jgi:hypothetical protein
MQSSGVSRREIADAHPLPRDMLRPARNDVEFPSDAAQIEIFFSPARGAIAF